MISGLRQHPIEVRASMRPAGDTPGAEQVRRSVPGLTLIRSVPLDGRTLLRWRARRYKRVERLTDAFAPVYRRRDMLGAQLFVTIARAGVEQIKLDDAQIESINLLRDDDTGTLRVSVRSKRGRKVKE